MWNSESEYFINPGGNFVCSSAPFDLKAVHSANKVQRMQKKKKKWKEKAMYTAINMQIKQCEK